MGKSRIECTYVNRCAFLTQLALPASAETLKVQYCYGDFANCHRYKLRSAGKQVAEDLWPDGSLRG
jgi:hypothetical protein